MQLIFLFENVDFNSKPNYYIKHEKARRKKIWKKEK
jgi:hypothetical protein